MDATSTGFVSVDGSRQDNSGTGWNQSGKGCREVDKPLWKSRTAIRSRSGDTSTLLHKHGVKLYKALPLGTIGQSLPDQCNEEQICSNKGFDLIVGAIRRHFRPYLEAEPDVQGEVALYLTTRTPKGTFVEFTSRISTNFVR